MYGNEDRRLDEFTRKCRYAYLIKDEIVEFEVKSWYPIINCFRFYQIFNLRNIDLLSVGVFTHLQTRFLEFDISFRRVTRDLIQL